MQSYAELCLVSVNTGITVNITHKHHTVARTSSILTVPNKVKVSVVSSFTHPYESYLRNVTKCLFQTEKNLKELFFQYRNTTRKQSKKKKGNGYASVCVFFGGGC